MKIYIDEQFRCHTEDPSGTWKAVESSFFDGKCREYIEGYKFIPDGENWTSDDGFVFHGEMAFAWKPWRELDAAQRAYERRKLADMAKELADAKAALEILGVSANE